jgi:dTDP-4-dehydrorhamnose reductase
MPTIIVTGKNGQLGNALEKLSAQYPAYDFVFADRETLNLSDAVSIGNIFAAHKPQYFVNCAAYTAVDKAESDKENAKAINADAVETIAKQCALFNTKLIQISTDYVFNGNGTAPYKTGEATEPVNYYGYTKWMGEQNALQYNGQSIIIRTSWVYSYHGNNFVKTMLRLMKERPELKVVNDQRGCPTYAVDLAEAIMQIIVAGEDGHKFEPGIYHYSNTGNITWFQFAEAIKEAAGLSCTIYPITTDQFPTPAKRPAYSVMDTSKITEVYNVEIKDWQQRLKACIQLLQA